MLSGRNIYKSKMLWVRNFKQGKENSVLLLANMGDDETFDIIFYQI